MNLRTLLLLLFIPLLYSCEQAFIANALSPEEMEAKRKKIKKNKAFAKAYEKHFNKVFQRKGSPGAAVSIVMDDQTVLAKGFGKKDCKKGTSVDEHTCFRIGSLSKGFAGVLTAKLMQDGVLSWKERVKPHIPDFSLIDPFQASRITLKHCLSHTVGIPKHSYTNLLEKNREMEDIIPRFKKVKHLKKEGSRYAYQNAAFALVEPVIEHKTGKNYKDLLKNELLYPLDMQNTSTSKNGLFNHDNFALPHEFSHKRKKWYPRKINNKYYNAVSAGGINSSATDMAKWLHLLVGNREEIVSTPTLDSIFSKRVEIKYEKRYYSKWKETDDSFYGLGWKIHEFKDREISHHGGYVNGFRSEIAIDRGNKVGISILFNAPVGLANTVVRDFFNFYDEFFEEYGNP